MGLLSREIIRIKQQNKEPNIESWTVKKNYKLAWFYPTEFSFFNQVMIYAKQGLLESEEATFSVIFNGIVKKTCYNQYWYSYLTYINKHTKNCIGWP